MSEIITVKDLCLWYGSHKALKDININIPDQSITALIGPSGCGKSTFLKTLNRMNDLIPDVKITGDVRYQGKDIFGADVDVSQLRREIGMVFQKPNPFPMTTSPTAPVLMASKARHSWTKSWNAPCGMRPFGTRSRIV